MGGREIRGFFLLHFRVKEVGPAHSRHYRTILVPLPEVTVHICRYDARADCFHELIQSHTVFDCVTLLRRGFLDNRE